MIVHAVTRKGNGFAPAENDQAEQMHQVKVINPETGKAVKPAPTSWTDVYSDELVRIGAERPDVVAITAAMLGPTGLSKFAAAYPDRCIDVGIAEQHAMTSAAGLAMGGMHPVFAVYSTFLNRARPAPDGRGAAQAAGHRHARPFGITGDDGASHNGMWDLSILGIIPGIQWRPCGRGHPARSSGSCRRDDPPRWSASKGAVIESPAVERFPEWTSCAG